MNSENRNPAGLRAQAGEEAMEAWSDIRIWRRATREQLLGRRLAVPPPEKQRIAAALRQHVRAQFPELRRACIGLYWPFKGEADFRPLIEELLADGADAALPVVVEKRQPLEFWRWRPRARLGRGIWNIPIPAVRNPVQPTVLLVPLLGFDEAGYRLGYGGGYYDRTLAALPSRPLTIGVGYELGRLRTIYPQAHDIPLDAIVTEEGATRFRCRGEPLSDAAGGMRLDDKLDEALRQTFPASDPFDLAPEDGPAYASPPCFLREIDPSYSGYLSTGETIALLNQLLEGERAGARAVAEMASGKADGASTVTLRDIATDEARFCAMLSRHIAGLGGTPSPRVGSFYAKLMASSPGSQRLDMLNRGQAWVVREIRKVLPRINIDALRRDLTIMLEVHESNIRRCTDFAEP